MNKIMVYIIHDRAIDEEVMDIFKNLGLNNYTKWRDIVGSGENGPHMGDHIWPTLNNVTMTVIEENMKERILERVKALQADFPFVGLRAMVVPVLEMI